MLIWIHWWSEELRGKYDQLSSQHCEYFHRQCDEKFMGPLSIADMTSYHKILKSLKALKFVIRIVWSLWTLADTHCFWGTCQISKWCYNANYQHHNFKTSGDLMIRHLIGYWNGALVLFVCGTETWKVKITMFKISECLLKELVRYCQIFLK